MAKVTVRRVVPGSQERVWHVLSDLDRFPEWLPNLERVEHRGGPARGLNREHTSHLADGTELHQKIVAWDNARRVGWRIERELRGGTEVGGYHSARTDIDLRPSGADTEMSITSSWRPSGPIAWLKSFMTGGVQSEHEAALSNFAALLESPDSDKADSSA